MKATIKHTLTESTINAYSVTIQENGEPAVTKLNPITLFGKISKEDAQKEVKKGNPNSDSVMVSSITEKEVSYEISVEDFVKYAKRIENVEKKENE